MITTILAIFFLLFFLLSLRRPLWAGIFILSTLPSYLIRFSLGPIPFTLLEGMIILFVITNFVVGTRHVASLQQRRRVNKKNLPFIILVLLFVLSGFISVFVAPELNTALGLFKAYIIEPILFCLIFILVLKNVGTRLQNVIVGTRHVASLRILFCSIGVSTLIISLYAIFQQFTGFGIPNLFWAEEETRRVTSFLEYPNALGLYLGPIVVLYFGIFLQFWHDKKIAIFSFSVFFLSLFAILFAQSEGALFGIIAGIFILLFFSFSQWKHRFLFFSATLLIFLVLILLPTSKNYLSQKISLNDFSGGIRKEMWMETISFLKTEPIFGAGISGYQDRITPFHKNPQVEIFLYPHNFFLNFYVEMGLLGLLSIIGLLILFFWRSRHNILLIATMTEILVHGMVDAPFFKNDLAVIFLFILFLGILTDSPKTRILQKDRAAEG